MIVYHCCNKLQKNQNHGDVEIDPWTLQVAAISPQCCHNNQVVP